MKKTLDIKSVCECNRRLGCKTLHPQASIINLEHPDLEQEAVKFEFYAVLLIKECPDGCGCCGRKYYDYSNATMVFLKPGEIFRMNEAGVLPDKGWLLAFHPDLLYRTSLKIISGTIRSFLITRKRHYTCPDGKRQPLRAVLKISKRNCTTPSTRTPQPFSHGISG